MKTTANTKMVLGHVSMVGGFLGLAVVAFMLRHDLHAAFGIRPAAILMIVAAAASAASAMVFMKYLTGNGTVAHGQAGLVRGTRSTEPTMTEFETPSVPSVHSVAKTAMDADAVFASSSLRLHREIHALSRRGNLNLTIGVITTAFALGLLAYMIFDESRQSDTFAAALSHYVPRVTTVTFIEVFSFFFLRLYRTSLEEIKFYQNELTSLASHQIALETSRSTQDPACVRQVLSEIARRDPNGSASSVVSRQSSVGTADDTNLTNAMNLLDRVTTLVAAGAKVK